MVCKVEEDRWEIDRERSKEAARAREWELLYPTEDLFPYTFKLCVAFAHFFTPILNRCPEESRFFYELPNGARFCMADDGDDVEYDFRELTNQDLTEHAPLFFAMNRHLSEEGLVRGKIKARFSSGVLVTTLTLLMLERPYQGEDVKW